MSEDIKIEIGKRIREERERLGLTREQVCDTEEELTVKQLMRIELGRSLPTIVKLQYISDKLGVSLNYLLGETKLDIPEDYYQAKYKLMKSPVYGDPERIKKKLKDIEELYDNYIEILPEDELFAIDIIERTLNFMVMEEDSLIESVFEDYLTQALKKEAYSLNDLLLISYYALRCQDYDYDKGIIDKFRRKLIKQELQGEELFNIELMGALTSIAGIYVMHHDYKDMKSVVDKLYEIMHSCMQHSYQPGIIVFEAKYYLFYENNRDKATELYNTATVLAEAFGDQVFIKNLKMEIKKRFKHRIENISTIF
ncbi:helix-turn-helix domain-containing protein [Streptococcus salivarius]|uniref:helix-turn-helix domain-containing protein n=1 Tax=Streptococcus salivarius TaxID=1304 RepID=UPI0012BD0ACE|nr:XRE family transcriptional regulator [Streptococcus salivarius]MTQ56400.1 helix-turn-helix domain-containing protein [Streptococcus salivarius]MTQ58661.1 helix-turn-helix domain-containing protein [Streptococcus salivarius]MTQ64300.1 helix-turn-helix domain-containing protein [Streptococcus salivarius]MTQ66671.1 helix-turn-helix domain-containing protein [Streptococcus salivarius]MTQ71018.1 helix-turn-helix domain-containing protein [Streptococcus salivarius]